MTRITPTGRRSASEMGEFAHLRDRFGNRVPFRDNQARALSQWVRLDFDRIHGGRDESTHDWHIGCSCCSSVKLGPQQPMNQSERITLFLCGDVMTGRGIDQILPCPGSPVLHERHIQDARRYVDLAEAAHGSIRRPVDFAYIWGDSLEQLERVAPDARIVNLETSVTSSEDAWPDKEVHYRMHPQNLRAITAAAIDCCCLANNHIMDWGYAGLDETLRALDAAGIRHAGAGPTMAEAMTPAILHIPGKGRVLLFSVGSTTSGIPDEWAASATRAGVNLLPDLSVST